MEIKLLSHLMKLFHLMTLPSQQFCLCGILFNVYDTLMKHTLRLALIEATASNKTLPDPGKILTAKNRQE